MFYGLGFRVNLLEKQARCTRIANYWDNKRDEPSLNIIHAGKQALRTRIANYWDSKHDEPCPTSLTLRSHHPFQLHFSHILAILAFRVSHAG